MGIPLLIGRRRLLRTPAGGGGGTTVESIGGVGAAATSFIINPASLGAQDGDFMHVMSVWESNNAVTTPAGWTEHIDETAAFGNAFARWSWASRVISGSPPGDTTFSYGGSTNLAYTWVILRGGPSSMGTVTKNTPTLGTGAFSIPVTVGSEGALVFYAADGSTQDPTAVADMTNVDVNGRAEDLAGMYAEVGWLTANATVAAGTSPFDKGISGWMWAPIS